MIILISFFARVEATLLFYAQSDGPKEYFDISLLVWQRQSLLFSFYQESFSISLRIGILFLSRIVSMEQQFSFGFFGN